MDTESTPPTRGKASSKASDGASQVITLTLRLPAMVAERLRRLARTHDRSLNGEIVRALRRYVAAESEDRVERTERDERNERSGE